MASGDNGLAALLEAFGVGNKSVKTDRGFQLDALGNLNKQSQVTGAEGADATGDALKFFHSILSGSRAGVTSAVAPQVNAAADQQQAQNRSIVANGTGRGGGTNSLQQQSSDIINGTTQDAINKAVPGAATALGNLGSTATGQSIGASGTLGGLAGDAHSQDQARSDQMMNTLTKLFSTLFPPGKKPSAPGGSSPSPETQGVSDLGQISEEAPELLAV